MRAKITDPQGPRIWRHLPYLATIGAFLFAVFGPIDGTPAVLLGVFSAIVFQLLGVFPRRQDAPRPAELECGPGYVDVKLAGTRNQRILVKDITGATTARVADGVLLTLQSRDRDQPITIHVSSDAEAEKIRQSLGIGHGGFGALSWRTAGDSQMRQGFYGRIVAAASIALITATAYLVGGEFVILASMLGGIAGFVGALLGIMGLGTKHRPPTVVMTAEGLRLLTKSGWFALPYNAILDVWREPEAIGFRVPHPYNFVSVAMTPQGLGGICKHEGDILLAQVTAASQRARGLGPQKNDVTGRLDMLRRNGQTTRDWLMRLDTHAQLLDAGPGYRGNTLDTEDLWAILEDPEAEPELRTAAARILRHTNARSRIDAILATVREEGVNRRLRVAVDADPETAAREIAFLEANDAVANRHRAGTAATPRW